MVKYSKIRLGQQFKLVLNVRSLVGILFFFSILVKMSSASNTIIMISAQYLLANTEQKFNSGSQTHNP